MGRNPDALSGMPVSELANSCLHRDWRTKFQPPKSCSVASGAIGPTDWCKLSEALPESARHFSRTEHPQTHTRRCAEVGFDEEQDRILSVISSARANLHRVALI